MVRKTFIALMIIVAAFTSTDCKKQAKCGCGKDSLFTLTNASAYIYFTPDGATISFQSLSDAYSTYYFCNPSEMFPNLKDSKSGDILQISGYVYWNCSYVSQASNSTYASSFKIYDVQVTDLTVNLYGKKVPVKPV